MNEAVKAERNLIELKGYFRKPLSKNSQRCLFIFDDLIRGELLLVANKDVILYYNTQLNTRKYHLKVYLKGLKTVKPDKNIFINNALIIKHVLNE